MGKFRTIDIVLDCRRCGRPNPSEVQFKTDEDDEAQHYTRGDRVDDLPLGVAWDGMTESFCAPCFADFRRERELAMATVLAALVRDGLLSLRHRGGPPLDDSDLLALGTHHAAPPGNLLSTTRVLAELGHLAPSGAWTPLLPPHWRDFVHDAHRDELRRRGWPDGDDFFRGDIAVHVDADGRIDASLTSSWP